MVFAGLTGLQGLDLSCNGLTALDLTLFDPFASSLTYLDVSGNSYGSTPTETTLRDKFDQITATSGSLYTGSNSECLPPYEFGLNGLSLSTGTLLPAFQAPGETVYTARVGRGVSSIDVAVTTSDPRATIEPRHNPFGTFLTPGLQLNLTHVRSDIGWQVRVRNGSFAVPYQIVVYRDQPLATNALLRSLELSGITLGKDFSGRTDTYTATAYVAETTVTATPLDPDATTVIRNNGVVDSDGTVSLAVGANTITVEVTAEDGVTKRTYTVDVTRTTAEYLATLPAPRLPTDDNRNAIWLATLTVADLGSNQYGYDGAPGGLTDTAFTYLGDDTPIPENQAFRLVGTLYTIDSSYFSAGQFHFSLDSAFVDDDADNIFVVVDGTRLKFSDASFDSSTHIYHWAMSNPSWTPGDEVTVKIVVLQEDDGPEDLAPTTTENGDEYGRDTDLVGANDRGNRDGLPGGVPAGPGAAVEDAGDEPVGHDLYAERSRAGCRALLPRCGVALGQRGEIFGGGACAGGVRNAGDSGEGELSAGWSGGGFGHGAEAGLEPGAHTFQPGAGHRISGAVCSGRRSVSGPARWSGLHHRHVAALGERPVLANLVGNDRGD